MTERIVVDDASSVVTRDRHLAKMIVGDDLPIQATGRCTDKGTVAATVVLPLHTADLNRYAGKNVGGELTPCLQQFNDIRQPVHPTLRIQAPAQRCQQAMSRSVSAEKR